MTVDFGSNVAGTSKGAYAIFPVTPSVGGLKFNILDADVVTGVVTAVPGAVPLTSIQATALSGILKGLIKVAPVGSNQLEYLRKLVGVLPLKDGNVVTLSVDPVAGDVWRLSAALAVGGTAFVYVPNAAACGPFTGDGASSGSSSPPGGEAGGVLGYPGSTYPDPTGLAGIGDVIPIKAPTGSALLIQLQAEATGKDLAIRAAEGTAGDGGDLILMGSPSSNPGGGGDIVLRNKDGGRIRIGNVSDPGLEAGIVEIGSAGKPGSYTRINSPLSFRGSTQSFNNPTTNKIYPQTAVMGMNSLLGDITLVGNPRVTDIFDPGTICTLVNVGTGTITIAGSLSTPAGANLKTPGGCDRILEPKASMTIQTLDGLEWVETAFTPANLSDTQTPGVVPTLVPSHPTVFLDNAGAVDLLGASPEVDFTGVAPGTDVTFIQTGAGTTKFNPDAGNTTYLKLPGGAAVTLAQNDSITFTWTGSFWVTKAYSNN